MNIRISFKRIDNKNKSANIENTIFKYRNIYEQNKEIIEVLSDKEISELEVKSLVRIYSSKNRDKVIKSGVIDLITDKYIIVNY